MAMHRDGARGRASGRSHGGLPAAIASSSGWAAASRRGVVRGDAAGGRAGSGRGGGERLRRVSECRDERGGVPGRGVCGGDRDARHSRAPGSLYASDGILYPIRLLAVVSLMEGGWEPHDLKVKAEAWVVISEFGMLHLEYVYPYRRWTIQCNIFAVLCHTRVVGYACF